jgi:chromosome segregation ATPase
MSDPDALDRAFKRLDEALARLEAAVERRAAEDASYAGLAEEVARLSDDRAQLALDLDAQLARAARLEEANKDVSRRLVSAMETIRSVLDAHGG